MNHSNGLHVKKAVSVAVLTALLYVAAWGGKVARYGGISAPVGFGCLSQTLCFAEQNRALLPETAVVFRSGGYDGQYYYTIAAELFSNQTGTVDARKFRLSRVGYPLLTGIFYRISPEALILAMSFLPLLFHLASIVIAGIFLHPKAINLLIYALNPFSLLTFLLDLSDGLALAFAVSAFAVLADPVSPETKSRPFLSLRLLVSLSFLSFSLLLKETFLLVAASLAAGHFFSALFADRTGTLRSTANRIPVALVTALPWLLAAIPLFAWWTIIGFSPKEFASHGGLPFQGIFDYLSAPDRSLRGRNLLVVLLLFYFLAIGLFGRRMFRNGLDASPHSVSLLFLLLANILFVLTATAAEYWANFANIARMFTPGVIALSFYPHSREWFFRVAILILFLFIGIDFYFEDLNGVSRAYIMSR